MLNPFPALLVYGILAPMLIRIAVGAVFFYLAVHHWRNRTESIQVFSSMVGKLSALSVYFLIVCEIVAAGFLIVGFYTQVAAIVAASISLKLLMLRTRLTSLVPFSRAVYILVLVMSLSLLLSGAGGLAFDLPL